jgi:AcrR family transcriptional regulator
MSTAERRRQLRENLIATAERAIAARGLAGLKARELAQEAGCALGAIYNVFPDLDALILAVNARTLAELDAVLREASSPEKSTAGAVDELVRLADAYLLFAAENRQRWRALFEHRLSPGKPPPELYAEQQIHLFSYIVAPLRRLRRDLPEEAGALLARTLFSAVHGIVTLGLAERLVAIPLKQLRAQMEEIVRALGRGLQR